MTVGEQAAGRDTARTPHTALVIDWGGVLTPSFSTCVGGWAEREDIDLDECLALIARHLGATAVVPAAENPFQAVECGRMPAEVFERELARMLRRRDGRPVEPAGLLHRMFADFTTVPAMTALLRRIRAAGIPTALLSNSWGQPYPPFDGLFDVTVLSCEAGARKPDAAAYRHVAELLGRSPRECVFVDDLASNCRGAEATGMTVIHHHSPETTTAAVCAYFDLPPQP